MHNLEEDRTVHGQALAALTIPFWEYQPTDVGSFEAIAGWDISSKSTISLVRYGFSLWQWGQRILKTWEFRCDSSASPLHACLLPTIAGTGIEALQCKHTTPRNVGRSVSMVILKPRRD
jgi:hypothetical protein